MCNKTFAMNGLAIPFRDCTGCSVSELGATQSQEGMTFTQAEISSLQKRSPFTMEETTAILRRYGTIDHSPGGQDGISVLDCVDMPEFTGVVFAPDVISLLQDPNSHKIHGKDFIKICAMFSSKTPAITKKEFLFDLFDVDEQKFLTHDGLFRIYKLLFTNAISDDHILALTFSALRHPSLAKEGQVTREEFIRLIPDSEIQERFGLKFVDSRR